MHESSVKKSYVSVHSTNAALLKAQIFVLLALRLQDSCYEVHMRATQTQR